MLRKHCVCTALTNKNHSPLTLLSITIKLYVKIFLTLRSTCPVSLVLDLVTLIFIVLQWLVKDAN